MEVVGEIHGAEVVSDTGSGLKEHGDELARRGEGMEVGLEEELEEDVIAKDVDDGGRGQGEVVVRDRGAT